MAIAATTGDATHQRRRPLLAATLAQNLDMVFVVLLSIGVVLAAHPIGPDGVIRALVGAVPLALNVIGISLVYRVDGHLNLAQLAIGVLAVGVFEVLNRKRVFIAALNAFATTDGPGPSSTALTINFTLSVLVALMCAVVLGWSIRITIMRRMEGMPALMAMVITVFIAQMLIGLRVSLIKAVAPESDAGAGRALPGGHLPGTGNASLFGVTIDLWQGVTLAVGLIAITWIALALARGPWGVRLRAVASNRDRSETLGINSGAVSSRTWALAGLLSGIAALTTALPLAKGPLAIPDKPTVETAGMDIGVLALLLVALTLGRFVRLWVAVAATFVLALAGQIVEHATGSTAWLEGSLVVVIALVLALRHTRSSRATRDNDSDGSLTREISGIPVELRSLEAVRGPIRTATLLAAITLIGAPALMPPSAISMAIDALVFALVALSVWVLAGWSGFVSLGQFGVAGVGAWAAAVSGVPFMLALPLGILAGALAGLLMAVPAIRAGGGLSLAILSLTFAVGVDRVLLNPKALGGAIPETVPSPAVIGLDVSSEQAYYYLVLAIVAAAYAAVVGVRRARLGRVLIALRSNEAAAQSFGVRPVSARLTSTTLAGALAGTAGVLATFHVTRLDPGMYTPAASVTVYLDTLVGGLGGVAGPILGTVFWAAVTFFGAGNALITLVSSGLGAVLLLIAAPGGLIEVLAHWRDGVLVRLAYRLHLPVPSLMGDGGAAAAAGRALLDEKRRPLRRPGSPPLRRYVPPGEELIHSKPTLEREGQRP